MMDIKEIESIVKKTAEEYKNTGDVKIGVSQRHIHLSREHLDILFGKGYELTKKKTLMGREFASEELVKQLAANGQIATQYADLSGNATMVSPFNPNGSMWAIEGITSPDGRVLGKMGHSERIGDNLYKNVEGNFDMKIFESGVKYFK